MLPELISKNVTSLKKYNDCMSFIVSDGYTDSAYVFYSNKSDDVGFSKRVFTATQGMTLIGASGAANY